MVTAKHEGLDQEQSDEGEKVHHGMGNVENISL